MYLTLLLRRYRPTERDAAGDGTDQERSDRTSERGIILLMAGMLMVFLLTVAAFAIDLGNVRQRQVDLQGAVDLAALAGAQDLPDGLVATSAALDSVELNIGLPRSAWNGCNDPEALTHVSIHPDVVGSNCISFNADFTIIRVTLPDQAVRTFFGGVVGIDEFTVTTSAEAAAIVARSGTIIPATVSAAVDPGLRCVETSGANTGCPTHVDGYFGTILSPRLHNFKPTTGNLDGAAQALNFALNLDHEVVPFNTGDVAVCDGAIWTPCTDTSTNLGNPTPNHLIISTGNDVPPVTEGLVSGGTTPTLDFGDITFCGRLTRPDFTAENSLDPLPGGCAAPSEPTIDHIGYTINGRHIYHWMTPDARSLFYPEVNVPEGTLAPVLTNSIYHTGDARLKCFMEGYRLDTSTGQETIPDCTSVGLNLPSDPGLVYQETWTAGYSSYADAGNPGWGEPWVEPVGDGGAGSGVFQMNSTNSKITIYKSASPAESVQRTVNLPPGTDVIHVKGNLSQHKANYFALEYSLDNSTWDTVAAVETAGLVVHDVTIDTGGAPAVHLRYRRTQDINGTQGQMTGTNLTIDTYSRTSPSSGPLMDPIFEPDMLADTRFATIPIIVDWPASGTKAGPITGFWYAYIYDLYGNNTKVQAFDAWVFDPSLAGHDRSTAFAGYGFDLNAFIRLER